MLVGDPGFAFPRPVALPRFLGGPGPLGEAIDERGAPVPLEERPEEDPDGDFEFGLRALVSGMRHILEG